MEGAASIHGDIHEAAPSELWEKVSFAPTNEPSLAYLEFLWNQYALSDFWSCTAEVYVGPGEWRGFSSNVKQKLPGSIPGAKKRLRRIKK